MNQQQKPTAEDRLLREAQMVADHYLNEFTNIDISLKARLVLAVEYPDPGVVERLQKELNCSQEEAEILWLDTKFWLWFCLATDKAVCPSAALDEGWHTFILFTREYQNFCNKVLGRFVHHMPHVGEKKPDPKAARALVSYTCKQVKRLFNAEHLSANWEQIIAVKCHNKCCDEGCKDQGCHGEKTPVWKDELYLGEQTVLHGTRSSNKVQQMKAVKCGNSCTNCDGGGTPSCRDNPKLTKLQASVGDCCEECEGSTNCQD